SSDSSRPTPEPSRSTGPPGSRSTNATAARTEGISVVTLDQHRTECLLRDRLADLAPGALRVGTTLTGLERHPDHVDATGTGPDGGSVAVRASFVIGLTDWHIGVAPHFTGVANYAQLLHDAVRDEQVHVGQLIIPFGIDDGQPDHS
ncbi:hypothetical protein IAE22_31420, partial [Bacillus sp. S34]|nr:hypothetical protein [Bacillus sp. S34]